jgi:hypothetical protein
MDKDEYDSEDGTGIEYKAGDMTVKELKEILAVAIEIAMKEAFKQAEAKRANQADPAHRTKEKRASGSTFYNAAGGVTYKG